MPSSILVVEDDLDLGSIMKKFLEDEGFQIHLARHGGEALEYLASEKNTPNGIILDLMMPEMNGWEFRARQLETAYRSIPVIVLTAASRDVEKIEVDAVLKKPVDLDLFVATIQKVFFSDSETGPSLGAKKIN